MPKLKVPVVISLVFVALLIVSNIFVFVALPAEGVGTVLAIYHLTLRLVFTFYSSLVCTVIICVTWASWVGVWIVRVRKQKKGDAEA